MHVFQNALEIFCSSTFHSMDTLTNGEREGCKHGNPYTSINKALIGMGYPLPRSFP
jgi:hypothetical protein